jgi:hypothetical protein|tara:strand:+ start:134 stop:523 length:390 start_codon:yes stop_codon:yes gene_type:complete
MWRDDYMEEWKLILKSDLEKGIFDFFPNQEAKEFYDIQMNNAYFSDDARNKFKNNVKQIPKRQRTVEEMKRIMQTIAGGRFDNPASRTNIVGRTRDDMANTGAVGNRYGNVASDPGKHLTRPKNQRRRL